MVLILYFYFPNRESILIVKKIDVFWFYYESSRFFFVVFISIEELVGVA